MSHNELKTSPVVAVIGGGQLARMMQESAIALGIDLKALVESADGATAKAVVHSTVGRADDLDAVTSLIEGAAVLTFEHEHIPQDMLTALEARPNAVPINPPASALLYAQDKLAMRERLTVLNIPCPRWMKVCSMDDLVAFGDEVGWPFILKTPVGGYDGHGVRLLKEARDAEDWLEKGTPLLAEERVPFSIELAALLARRPSGEIRSWPVMETVQKNGVCAEVIAPAPNISSELAEQAEEIGEKIASELGVTGILAVEMFVVHSESGDRVMVNELAMRPHNSGHWTIDGSETSQFEQHLRAVLDLPLGDTAMRCGNAAMVNLLGSELPDPAMALGDALVVGDGVHVHLYGKEVRPGRKLGHVTVCGDDPHAAVATATQAVRALQGIHD